ncbi:MAG: hypothetical protein IT532_07545 [Burkholderiales bacterium]|nr:hypothetical protein [Burkholderiales bacterium]
MMMRFGWSRSPAPPTVVFGTMVLRTGVRVAAIAHAPGSASRMRAR